MSNSKTTGSTCPPESKAAMKAVEKEMDDFQKEKQGALNQIDVALTLSLHQVM